MERQEEVKAMIKAVILNFTERLAGYRVFLFGSRAAGTARTTSDFDIGIMGSSKLPLEIFYGIEDALEELPTLYRIELVDFANVGNRFKEQALKEVEVIL